MVQCQKQAVYNQRDQCSIDHFRYNDPSQIEEQADPSAKEKLKKITGKLKKLNITYPTKTKYVAAYRNAQKTFKNPKHTIVT